jgi:putative flippase GtrA
MIGDPKATGQALSSSREFLSFVLVGAISATVSLISRYFFSFVVLFEIAVVLSQVVGIFVAFSLNRLFVFSNRNRLAVFQFGRFVLVNAMSLGIAAGVSSIAFRLVLPGFGVDYYPEVIAQIIGLAACTIPSFLGHKYFSFRSSVG